jgi:bacterioferritin-associated ferredoxin
MAKGKKLDNKKIAEIITSYALTNNYKATAKVCGVCANSVKNVVNKQKKNNPKEYAKVCTEKKELFSVRANKIIDKSLELLNRRFDTALNEEKEIEELINVAMSGESESGKPLTYQEKLTIAKKLSRLQINSLSEITTSMGTLYDKMRLDKGETTQNNSIVVKMTDEVKELSK